MQYMHRNQYLDSAYFEVKTMRKVSARFEFAAAGGHLNGCRGTRVVRWDPNGRNVGSDWHSVDSESDVPSFE